MVSQKLVVALLASYLASAIPLNINLGAYSPALVVGDGEISFGGSPERASEVLQTLATGAENGAVPPGQAPPRPAEGQKGTANTPPPQPVSPAPVSTVTPIAATAAPAPAPSESSTSEGIGSPLVAGASGTSDENKGAVPFDPSSPVPPEFISHKFGGPLNPVTKYPNMVKSKAKAKARRSLVPDAGLEERDAEADLVAARIKRDIDGFREALNFAREAQKDTPKIELAFGITKSPGTNVPVNSAANGALPPAPNAAKKRQLPTSEDNKLGMTLIAIGEV